MNEVVPVDIESEKQKRRSVLELLYNKMIRTPLSPAMNARELETELNLEKASLDVTVWYMKERELIRTGDNGRFLLGMARPEGDAKDTAEYRTHKEASPVTHITPDDPPFLLMHGDKDARVNIAQSEEMEANLKAAGIAVKFLRIPGAGHGPTFPGAVNPPDYLGEMVRWFDQHLIRK